MIFYKKVWYKCKKYVKHPPSKWSFFVRIARTIWVNKYFQATLVWNRPSMKYWNDLNLGLTRYPHIVDHQKPSAVFASIYNTVESRRVRIILCHANDDGWGSVIRAGLSFSPCAELHEPIHVIELCRDWCNGSDPLLTRVCNSCVHLNWLTVLIQT